MKLRTLLPSIIFLLGAFSAKAQVTEMFYQGFETSENVNYRTDVAANLGYSTTLQMSGARALKLDQSSNGEVTLYLDTLDFTQDLTLRYISLEFDHICPIRENNGDYLIARIFFKRPDQPDNPTSWTQLNSQYYNMTNGGSSEFQMTGAFNRNSYDDWLGGNPDNDCWKSERFDLNDVITTGLTTSQRKLQIKFVIASKTHNSPAGSWYIDNIKINASPSLMVRPNISMFKYPDMPNYASSRGADIVLDARTTVAEGINADSVYLIYRIGSSPQQYRVNMTPVSGVNNRFSGHIPFEGYDTMMYFYCVVRDATTNANRVTFPLAANGWVEYRCVRGVAQPGILTPGFTGTSTYNFIPFPARADNKSEWVYDSALLAQAGYEPGSITAFTMTLGANVNNAITRPSYRIKMANVPTNYTVNASAAVRYFTESYMQTVYDGPLTINSAIIGSTQTIQLQDTFRYAGKDILMQASYDDNLNRSSATIQMIATATGKTTLWYNGGDESVGGNGPPIREAYNTENRRPAFVFHQEANLPLLHDMGISELVYPNYETPMVNRPDILTVRLKNFGALTTNGIRISYSIDNGAITGHYDWSGSLNANQTTDVTIATNINLPAGFHTLTAWVEDTLTAGTQRLRDHEPYNDTSSSAFIVCDGPMNGSRNIGGTNPDFNTIEEFLYAVSRCGINDSLVVNIAPGRYPAFTVPAINGLTDNHYIVFRPATTGVTFYSDADMNVSSIVNLAQASNIRFRDINFVRVDGSLTDMVSLGDGSDNCHFERCTFTDSLNSTLPTMRIASMINSGYSDGMVVDGCTFHGGRIGVAMTGLAADILSLNNSVLNSTFYNQNDNAISVQNQSNAVIQGNEMYDVTTNSSYVLLLYECYGATRVLANKIYTSHGAGAIGVSNVIGTSATHALIANNMIVCNDDGSANLMTSPLNVIQATWTDVVYNSVKMTAMTRSNVSAATLGGGTIANNRFINNILVALDNNNYAFNYFPSPNNTVGYNVYYSTSGTLCRQLGNAYASIEDWITAFPEDANSISTNPYFLNGSLVDLRTYNRLIKGVGMPLATVPTDMFDSLRSTTATCPGAFEFVSLGYDFEPEALVSPELETCYMPSSVELAVRLRNSGVNAYTTTTGLSLAYQINGGMVNTVNITDTVPAEDTTTIFTGRMLTLPPNGKRDSLYTIKVWTIFANDPNLTNDTNTFYVLSRYRPVTPTDIYLTPDYATTATITPTGGIENWAVYGNTSAPSRSSTIYWYRDSTDAAPFHVGPTFTTDTLRTDTVFYIAQRRNMPIVRITQLEFARNNNVLGLTPNMPYWMISNRKVALQLTNIGDATAYLEGDTLMTMSNTANLNNKVYVFGDVSIEPGQSLVVQFVNASSSNPTMTVTTGSSNLSSITVQHSSTVAFVYRHGGVVEDMLVLNATSSTSNWPLIGQPSYVWSGNGFSVAGNTVCGLVRTQFYGNANDWRAASPSQPMFLNTNDPAWMRYSDNGCDGYFGKVNITLNNAPLNDLHLTPPTLPATQCAMGNEDITVTVHNYGIQPVDTLTLNYCAGGDTVSETITTGIPANGVITHTFTQQLNMAFDRDSLVIVKVWADALANDQIRSNDTSYASTTSLYTPAAPVPPADRTVFYADRDTITMAASALNLTPVWYNYDMDAVDTGYTYITDRLYMNGTMGVAHIVTTRRDGVIGTGTTQSTDSEPNPYNVKNKYARQQYIYSANELHAAGLEAGPVEAIHFYLDAIGNNTSQTLYNYTIGIGATTDTAFPSTSWYETQTVCSYDQLTITGSQAQNWVRHAFDTPYEWDGTSSMVVEVNYNLPAAINNGSKTRYTTKTNSVLMKYNSSEFAPTVAGTRKSNRPNIMFDTITYGCTGPISTFNVTMTNIPPVDMALYWPSGSDTIHYNSCDSIPIFINLRNQGSDDRSNVTIYYYLDNEGLDSLTVAGAIASGDQRTEQLFKKELGPGRHTITSIVHTPNDFTSSNDTIAQSFIVHFCRGTYTIALNDADYSSFGEAIDTLNVAGIEGPVVFQVSNGTYNEQVALGHIEGSSDTNTISFVGMGNEVLLTAATTQTDNYVMRLDSASNVILSNFKIEARPTATGNAGNHANALVMQNGDNITLDSMTIKVKGTADATTAAGVVLNDNISNLTVTNCIIDSGYYSIKTNGTGYSNLLLTNNIFRNFTSLGLNLRNITNLEIRSNQITSGTPGKPNRLLTGMYLAQTEGTFKVEKNQIYLIDNQTGGKRGIQLANIASTSTNKGYVTNNMISASSRVQNPANPANNTQESAGIWADSTTSNVNIYYNTIRVSNGTTASQSTKTYGFRAGATVSGLQVMNNIFSNFSNGYAYYVSELNTLSASNFNAYYSAGTTPLFWKFAANSLSALQARNGADGNSVFDEPFFTSENDLHLLMTNFVALAQYNTDVIDDIDGKMRPPIPAPTIGAHEMEIKTHDMAVVRILDPSMPVSLNFSATNMPPNIESDDVRIIAQFYNNGRSTENDVTWYAYIEGHEDATRTTPKSLGTFQPAQMKRDTIMMPTVLGIIDTAIVHVVVEIPVDSAESNNNISTPFYLAPAFNLEATRMSTSTPGCYMHKTAIHITLTNKGFKTIPANTELAIGYTATQMTPATITIPTLPASDSETITLAEDLYIGNNTTITFTDSANLYPTGHASNITVKVSGWCNYVNDVSNDNDTTANTNSASPTINSYYTPAPPIGYDTIFSYGTWGAVRASQENQRPIMWYRDSTAAPFYQPTNYNASTLWSNTPQYFDDSVYYLSCRSQNNCQSHFSQVHVQVNQLVPNDVAFDEVLAPLGSRVYMENDTVRIRIINYGTSAQTNVPVAYQLKRGANIIQEVSEVCTTPIASGQTVEYTFSELLNITTPTQLQNYSLLIWTDLPSDVVRKNDTIRVAHSFRSLAENNYAATKSSNPTFDITRISYNEINLDLPPMGRGYTEATSYNNHEYPVLHVTRGSGDTLIVEITPTDPMAEDFRYKTWAMIDFDRSGSFAGDEVVVNGQLHWNYEPTRAYITIPTSASYGYMRMRVCVGSNNDYSDASVIPTSGIADNKDGHAIDFLLFVDEEGPETDLSITQIVSPRNQLVRNDQTVEVKFRIMNKGTTALTNPTFHFRFDGDTIDPTAEGTVNFTGTLQPGTSGDVTLPVHTLPLGTSTLTIWHNTEGDTIHQNDTLQYEYHRFHVVELVVDENFDSINMWYAPKGYNAYMRNYWTHGTPNKVRITGPHSEPYAWVTDPQLTISTGRRGNASYLYSPIIDISQVKPDTLSFYLRRNLTGGSSVHLEFYNYMNRWVKVDFEEATNWYNNADDRVFDGSSGGSDYNRYWLSTKTISGDFQERLQFRFVYNTPLSNSATASFGEGCAVDNFKIGRAPIPTDVGVIDITEPSIAQYGRTYYPKVVVKNFGTDTARSFQLGYTTYGTFLSRESTVTCLIPPGGSDTLTFDVPFVVTNDFPENFDIMAFTQWDLDIYRDNDTLIKHFSLSPLDDDISAHEFIYPRDKVVAGDTSVQVTLRIRNFGVNPIARATASYMVNDVNRVDEEIDFTEYLGQPLQPLAYFNYTFRQRLRAPMGLMKLTGIIKSEQNEYIYNDTIIKRVQAISLVTDLAAAAVVVDTSDFNSVMFQLKIENRGSTGANGFRVGFLIDDDPNTMVTETYSRARPLPGLSTAYHMFNVQLPHRAMGYPNVTGFVSIDGDNDQSNDSTKVLETLYTDLEATKVLVEETGEPDCRVRLQVINRGNLTVVNRGIHARVTINGNSLSFPASNPPTIYLRPGDTTHIQFNQRIPKSMTRSYSGEGDTRFQDANPENNKTTVVEVINHFEGVPTVLEDELVLDQNYPNPFTGKTTIPFVLPNAAKVRFFVIDAMGHMVNSFEQHYDAGRQTITLDMGEYSSGVYFYGIEVDGQRRMKKMIMR